MKHKHESRISGFHRLSIADRQEELARRWDLNPEEMADLRNEAPLALSRAAQLTENTVGIYALPMGVALNFRVDGEDRLVPMVTEEPSVIAAASNAARLALDGGGFRAESDPSSMIAQIQLVDVPDPEQAKASIEAASGTLMERIDALAPGMARRGGGARSIEVRILPAPMEHTFVVVHLHIDVGDAMGANAINTIAEELAPEIAALSGGRAHLRILSNLPDRRVSRAEALYTFAALEMPDRSGAVVARAIELASLFAEADPYRAATHNKGIMNGIDAVAIATGNDWRALEASAHAFAAIAVALGVIARQR